MTLAKRAKQIRRRCRKHSQNRTGLGISELFLACPKDAAFILAAKTLALKAYLLGYGDAEQSAPEPQPGTCGRRYR